MTTTTQKSFGAALVTVHRNKRHRSVSVHLDTSVVSARLNVNRAGVYLAVQPESTVEKLTLGWRRRGYPGAYPPVWFPVTVETENHS